MSNTIVYPPIRHIEYPSVWAAACKWQPLPPYLDNTAGRLGYCGADIVIAGSQTLIILRFGTLRSTMMDLGQFTATRLAESENIKIRAVAVQNSDRKSEL